MTAETLQEVEPADPTAQPDALAALQAWFDTHIRDSKFSRDTGAHNAIHAHLVGIRTAIESVRE